MKTKIFVSYGVLAHEKKPVYTIGNPASDIYDEIMVEIPEKFSPRKTESGDILVEIEGCVYLLREVLAERGEKPVIKWYDGHYTNCEVLHVVK